MKHQPVLLEEVLEGLSLKEGGVYIDGTVGYGGHTFAMADQKKCSLTIYGFDRDKDALDSVEQSLDSYPCLKLIQASYAQAREQLAELGVRQVDGILLDIGVSSPQLDQAERGFSLRFDGPLDMRFDVNSTKMTAADILNTYHQSDLARIFSEYGEERFAKKIAGAICKDRVDQKFASTLQLVELIERIIPRSRWPKNIHPATRVFQALRIEVNQELEQLKIALPELVSLLKPGGRIAIISFHSLEDRIVKNFFRYAQKDCICPKEFPKCVCDKEQLLKVITKKPITATKTEIKINARSRSAKLRIAERV
jgi:16S rRNA (cytosine1402-N4)-methyltransferase